MTIIIERPGLWPSRRRTVCVGCGCQFTYEAADVTENQPCEWRVQCPTCPRECDASTWEVVTL